MTDTHSFVVKALSNVSSRFVSVPRGRIIDNLVDRISVGTPNRVFVVANTFCKSFDAPRGYDCTKKKRMEQKKMLSERSTLGGRDFGGGRVRYAVFNALK